MICTALFAAVAMLVAEITTLIQCIANWETIWPIVHMMTHENSHGLGCGDKSHCHMSKNMRLKDSSDTNVWH